MRLSYFILISKKHSDNIHHDDRVVKSFAWYSQGKYQYEFDADYRRDISDFFIFLYLFLKKVENRYFPPLYIVLNFYSKI